jgi:signal transduction histidine kinase
VIARLWGPVAQARTWRETAHLLADLPFGIAWFTIVVTGVSIAAGTLVTLIGIPVLMLTLLAARMISAVERARVRAFLGTHIASPFRRLDGNLWQRFKQAVSEAPAWTTLAYSILMLPVGIITFTLAVTMWATAAYGLTYPAWGWLLGRMDDNWVLWHRTPLEPWQHVEVAVVHVVVGAVFLALSPRLVHGLAVLRVAMTRGMTGRTQEAELAARVTQLTESREASVDAAEAERRRIERDLHDGAQQRLVAVAMDLGLARERLEASGDAGTAAIVAGAHEEAKRAIVGLRDLVRGIHPAVLADRGLDAALSSLAARSPVPVDVTVDVSDRPPGPIETVAYFVVAEALTNVAKHARARSAVVRVIRRDDVLVVEVTDDGIGGAAVGAGGGGLAGLQDRVRAVEGTLRVASPPGGPTTLLAELPCAS